MFAQSNILCVQTPAGDSLLETWPFPESVPRQGFVNPRFITKGNGQMSTRLHTQPVTPTKPQEQPEANILDSLSDLSPEARARIFAVIEAEHARQFQAEQPKEEKRSEDLFQNFMAIYSELSDENQQELYRLGMAKAAGHAPAEQPKPTRPIYPCAFLCDFSEKAKEKLFEVLEAYHLPKIVFETIDTLVVVNMEIRGDSKTEKFTRDELENYNSNMNEWVSELAWQINGLEEAHYKKGFTREQLAPYLDKQALDKYFPATVEG
jgi:hypothetical protein